MGNKDSKPAGNAKCLYCALPLVKGTVQNAQKVSICRRCGAPIQKSLASAKAATKAKSDAKGGDTKYQALPSGGATGAVTAEVQLPLHRVHLRPFGESLDAAQRNWSEREWLEREIVPHFRAELPVLERGSRVQIRGIDWKVVACYPPTGVVTANTRFGVGKPLSALQQIRKIHILPTAASLQDMKVDQKQLFEEHVKPYFTGSDERHVCEGEMFVSNGIEFKILACLPENGTVSSTTEIFADGAPIADLQKLHLLPIYETLPNSEKQITPAQIFERYFAPYLEGRAQFFKRDEERDIDGVSFMVIACDPPAGIATIETELYATGSPIRADDLKAQQLARDEQIARDMQRQEARAQGYVWGGPRRAAPLMFGPGSPRSPEELQQRFAQVLAQMPPDDPHRPIVERLMQQLAVMAQLQRNGDGGQLQFVQLLSGMEAPSQGASRQHIESLPTRKYKRKPQPQPQAPAKPAAAPAAATGGGAVDVKAPGAGGAAPAAGAAPDSKSAGASAAAAAGAASSSSSSSSATNSGGDHNTCRVCLCEYEEGEDLRTLPCFHSYHTACIDQWLKKNKRCPMCKTAIC